MRTPSGGRRRDRGLLATIATHSGGSDGSRSSVEAGLAVGEVFDLPVGVVGAVVVEGAEQLAVGHAGLPASGPGHHVVGFAEGGGHGAADLGAAGVAQVQRLADGGADPPTGAAEVE